MAKTTVTRVYNSYDKAASIVRELEAAEIPHDDITLLSKNTGENHAGLPAYTDEKEKAEGKVVYETAVGGGVLGGGAGLLAGLGLIAIPGFGPIAAAGWLAATLAGMTLGAATGAAAEGIADALTGTGISKEEAERYAEHLQAGGTLIAVKCDPAKLGMVELIMGVNDTGFVMGEKTADPTTTGRRVA